MKPSRERFEQWAATQGFHTDKTIDGRYNAFGTAAKWVAWQASEASVRADSVVLPMDVAQRLCDAYFSKEFASPALRSDIDQVFDALCKASEAKK